MVSHTGRKTIKVVGRSPIKLHFTVWQFVRMMVFMEDSQNSPGSTKNSLVLSQRREIWRALDAKLAGLGKKDAQAFSELMMEQDVVLEDVSLEELCEFITAAEGVVKALRKESQAKQRNETVAAGLIFEFEEMQVLLKGLQRRKAKISGKRKP
ncbi:MAG: hypothetical protein ACO3MW_03220 [Rhodospirillales bacterium]|jgi:hypothetical protein